jgi:hypothetical protein
LRNATFVSTCRQTASLEVFMLTRRIMLGGAAATAGALVLPRPASARFLTKLRWKDILEVGANIAGIVTLLREFLGGSGNAPVAASGPAPPRICAANSTDLAVIHRLWFQLALATNTKDYQAGRGW